MSTLQDAPMTKAEWTERLRLQYNAAVERGWTEIAHIFWLLGIEWGLLK